METRGKALLTHFSNDLTLYSHNQLYGVWRVVDTGEEPQTTRVLRVKLQTADKTILLYSASDIEMLTPEQLTTHPFLQRVGPDVLDPARTDHQFYGHLCTVHHTGIIPERQRSSVLRHQRPVQQSHHGGSKAAEKPQRLDFGYAGFR